MKKLLAAGRRSSPKGYKVFGVPADRDRDHLRARTATVCPGASAPPTQHVFYLFKFDPTSSAAGPGDDGQRPEAVGHAAGLRPDDEPAVVLMQFTGKGSEDLPGDHAKEAQRGQRSTGRRPGQRPAQLLPALRDRPRQRDQVVPDDRLHRSTRRDLRRQRRRRSPGSALDEAKNLALVLQTGALPVSFVTRSSSTESRRRSARTRSTRPRSRPLVGLLVVALFLLLFYRFLGLVAVIGLAIYAALPVRRDPAPPRHADAAGLRRPDPHDRRRGRRERRHLRTHQGRSAVREVRPRTRSRPATRRASTRSSTRTSSRRSPRSSSSRSRPRASRASRSCC